MSFRNVMLFTVVLLGCSESKPIPQKVESSPPSGNPGQEVAADPASLTNASAPSASVGAIGEFLRLHEGLSKFKESDWDSFVEALQTAGGPYTLTLIDELAFPVAKQSFDDPKVDEQLKKLDRLGKAIYVRIPSGEVQPDEVQTALETLAYAELISHPLKESLWSWTMSHLEHLASQAEIRKRLEDLRDSYHCELVVASPSDSSTTIESLVPDYARQILSRAEPEE